MRDPTLTLMAVALFAVGGCAMTPPADPPPSPSPSPSPPAPASAAPAPTPAVLERAARADSVRQHYNQADVDFMTGMIHHHAQALVMSRMAPTHGASEPIRTLTARIINGQRDEIRLMQRWLRERGEPVPQVAEDGTIAGGAGHAGHGGHHTHGDSGGATMMAGMLSPEQLSRLDAARGEEWDRLFLTYMIQHHRGALTMVEELFSTYGAAQGDEIFKIAADISADQASEIDRMQRMLAELLFGGGIRPDRDQVLLTTYGIPNDQNADRTP